MGIPSCSICGASDRPVSRAIGVCGGCLRLDPQGAIPYILRAHEMARALEGLPLRPPGNPSGLRCRLCANECALGEGEVGYCGLRKSEGGRLKGPTSRRGNLSWYYDPLPTNCVSDWVCPGGSGIGYPRYSFSKGPEYGFKNLAVFYHGCPLDCLFCQNAQHRWSARHPTWVSSEELASMVDERTACICYFGGDPSSQAAHAIRTSWLALRRIKDRPLRICWETNGFASKGIMKVMALLSLRSGGIVKVDLKAWHDSIYMAFCGATRERPVENITLVARLMDKRPDLPLLVVSTLLVPGYVDVEEVGEIARFLADLNPEIPYALLGFAPHFHLRDLPTTSRSHAERCRDAALTAGLKRVRIGNIHLLRPE